jgi:hypothetical protein
MMTENSGINIKAQDNVTSVGGTDASNQEVNIISGEVSNAVNQLPASEQAGLAGIKEVLTQLQSRIEGNDDLPSWAKVEALQQVKALAEAGKNPQAQKNHLHAETALKELRGMFGKLPKATNFIEACTQLLPDIAEIFGLQ